MRKYALAAATLLALATPAFAVVLQADAIDASGTTTIQGVVQQGGQDIIVQGLTGTLFLDYEGTSNGGLTWNFDYTVTNTTSGVGFTSELSAFGLTTTPNVVSATVSGTVFDTALVQVQAGFLGVVDFCASSGATCGGGGSGGLLPGQSSSGEFTLTFGSVLDAISLDNAIARFQAIDGTVNGVVYGDASGFGINNDVNITPFVVPSPALGAGIPGMIAGALGLWALVRRRQRHELAV
jgi:hypothetical protein